MQPQKTERQMFIEDMGSRYPVMLQWGKGPIPDRFRTVTDTPCLLLYALFTLFMIGSSVWAFSHSSKSAFTLVRDSSGNICGQGAAANHPILYLQTFSAPYKSVCVSECPKFDYSQIRAAPGGAGNADGDPTKPLYFGEFTRKHAGNSYSYAKVLTEAEAFAYPKFWANGYFTEAQWHNYLSRYPLNCLPNNQFPSCQYSSQFAIYDSYRGTRAVCTPLNPKAALLFNQVSSRFSLGPVEDLVTSLPLYAYTAAVAIGVSLFVLAMVYFLSRSIVWLLLGLTTAALLSVSFMILHGIYARGFLNDPINPLRVKYLQFWMDYKPWLLIIAVLFVVAALYTIHRLVWYRRYAGISEHLVRHAASQIMRETLLIGLSMGILLLMIALFFWKVMAIVRLLTSGRVVHDAQAGAPFVGYDNPWWTNLLVALHAFGLYWHLCVLNHLNKFVITAMSVSNYFNTQISLIHAFCHTLGHHVGTLAWTIVLLPLSLLRYGLSIFDTLLTSDTPNVAQRFARQACSLCCWAYENFIDGFSERFMPITYIGSYNFFPANHTAYALSQLHAHQVGVLLNVGDIIALCTRLIVTFVSAFIGYRIYVSSIYYQQNINNIWLLWVGLVVLSYFIADVFLSVFSSNYNAVFMCHAIQQNLSARGIQVSHAPVELTKAVADYNIYSALN